MFDTTNLHFINAWQFANHTRSNIFLTGKAGTGKTTFLKQLQQQSIKKMVVVAPTGVAAINAGGVTMHSFFQLPFGPFLPISNTGWQQDTGIADKHSLLKNIRFNADKRELLQELELLVIDEVSMLRSDMLDAIDTILRTFRKQHYIPFGGVQVLLIGDLFQLPPVVNNEEWNILKQHYKSPFFFDALVMQEAPPIYIELKKIYRQNEQTFINLLNNVRNAVVTNDDLEVLHQRYKPDFVAGGKEQFITLTSHNAKADAINQQALAKLKSHNYAYKGIVSGDFNERALPAEMSLQLKEGAQVMFIKNDKGENRRYYNGKLAEVSRLTKDAVFVKLSADADEMEVEKETWRNIKYSFNKDKHEIEEEEIGTYSQYPLRLAWAITIHKSQGLTFEKAVVDAGDSFAAGQVYVALSRLTTLEGLILKSRITTAAIQTDARVLAFTGQELSDEALQQELLTQQQFFVQHRLVQSYQLQKLSLQLQQHLDDFEHRQIPERHTAIALTNEWLKKLLQLEEVAQKFSVQIDRLLQQNAGATDTLLQRLIAGNIYFDKEIEDNLLQPMQKHYNEMQVKQKTKKYCAELAYVQKNIKLKKEELRQAVVVCEALLKGKDAAAILDENLKSEKEFIAATTEIAAEKKASTKPQKGESHRVSLAMFKEGKTIATIAKERSMSPSTIEGHLASFIPTGEVKIEELVPAEKLKKIIDAVKKVGGTATTPIKEILGDEFTHGEIRAVIHYIAANLN